MKIGQNIKNNNYYTVNNKNNNKTHGVTNNDGLVTLTANLERGVGNYKKGLFKKVSIFQFVINVDFKNKHHTAKDIIAYINTIDGSIQKRLNQGVNIIEIGSADINQNNVKVKVVADYIVHRVGKKSISVNLNRGF